MVNPYQPRFLNSGSSVKRWTTKQLIGSCVLMMFMFFSATVMFFSNLKQAEEANCDYLERALIEIERMNSVVIVRSTQCVAGELIVTHSVKGMLFRTILYSNKNGFVFIREAGEPSVMTPEKMRGIDDVK